MLEDSIHIITSVGKGLGGTGKLELGEMGAVTHTRLAIATVNLAI